MLAKAASSATARGALAKLRASKAVKVPVQEHTPFESVHATGILPLQVGSAMRISTREFWRDRNS